MVPLSLAIATSARISYWRGAGDEAMARRLVTMGWRLAATGGLVLASALFLSREGLASIYSSNPEVVSTTASLLAWVAAYHVADADRKSTRLNSSHSQISYAVFCLKKKKKKPNTT